MPYRNLVGTKVPNASPVRQGDRVRVRDAYGDWHEMDALSGPQWGRDFVVVWVARLAGDDPIPWPVEDVEALPAPTSPDHPVSPAHGDLGRHSEGQER